MRTPEETNAMRNPDFMLYLGKLTRRHVGAIIDGWQVDDPRIASELRALWVHYFGEESAKRSCGILAEMAETPGRLTMRSDMRSTDPRRTGGAS